MAFDVFVRYKNDISEATAANDKLVKSNLDVKKSEETVNKAFVDAAKERSKRIKEEQQDLRELKKRRKDAFSVDEIDKFNKSIQETERRIKTLGGEVKRVDKAGNALNSTFKKVAGVIAAAFTIDALITFGREAFNVAKEGIGIRLAFERLNKPDLLNELRSAVRGTVQDIELMRGAVKASNFEVPLDRLAKLFQFAQQRARETGQSVQFLVDSIVSGIGRKSPLILDNLGISAVRLRKELRGVGVETASVAAITDALISIIDEQLNPAMETEADRIDRATASWKNFQLSTGNVLVTLFANITDGIINQGVALQQLLSGQIGFEQFIREQIKVIGETTSVFKALTDEVSRFDSEGDFIAKIAEITLTLEPLRERFGDNDVAVKQFQQALNFVNSELDKFLDRGKESVRNVAFLNAEIRKQTAIINASKSSIEDINTAVSRKSILEAELAILLGKTKEAQDKANDSFKRGQKIIDLEFRRAIKDATADINEFINTTLSQIEAAGAFFDEEESLLLANAELRASLANDRIELENAQFQTRLNNLRRNIDEEGNLTAAAREQERLLTEQHEQNLTNIAFTQEQKRLDTAKAAGEIGVNLVKIFGNREAQTSKEFAVFQIALNQAVAIAELIKDVEQFGVTPIDKALILVQGIARITAGIAQARALLQNVPALAKGTENFKGGLAVVGEKGFETQIHKGKAELVGVGGPELRVVPKGAQIKSHSDSVDILQGLELSDNPNKRQRKFEDNLNKIVVKSFNDKRMVKATQDNKNININNVAALAKAVSEKSYLDKRYRL